MKNNIFRIRKIGDPAQTSQLNQLNVSMKKLSQADYLKYSIQKANEKMVDLMALFETFMKTSIKQTSNKEEYQGGSNGHFGTVQREVRDRHVQFHLPQLDKLSKQDAQKWMTEVCMTTFSTSFHYYLTQQMSFQQTKVFCSENILRNLLRLTEKFKLTDKQIQNLNRHIGGKVLQYLQKKYPQTQSNDVNKALQKQVQETNHLDLLTNDFLYNSGIMFKYNEDGNYNDMIMKVINKAIEMYDQASLFPSNHQKQKSDEEQSNYRDFQGFMSTLFQSVYDERWMAGSKEERIDLTEASSFLVKKINLQNHKEKYEQKVKSYTNYQIGRKISQNTVPYTQAEIKSKNLTIKNAAILRILTKWCEQLWQKFQNPTYFTQITQSIQLQDPQIISPFFKWMKTSIDSLAQVQKKNILSFKGELDRNSYNQQSQFLLKHLQQDNVTSIPKYQKASGKFATQMVKNLHSYIILYLNRLIHGLLTISKQFYDSQEVDKTWDDWHAPPNLVTFKIGDLLRCKISSKQKEIVRIFKQIKKISNTNAKKLKIVRIKNRLKEGTNDLLINIKFNNLIICQIQLQVINKSKSKFIQCSNKFSHYIYEMKRSIFGPISQLCNIWNNFQARAAEYESLVKIPKAGEFIPQQCIDNTLQHQLVKFDLPFQCNYCRKLYYHNNYIISNKQCNKCSKYKCVKCQISDMDENQLKKTIFTSKKERNIADCSKKSNFKEIPRIGVCVKIESTFINTEVFQFTKYQGKKRLLAIKQGQIYNIKTIKSQKDIQDFLDKYCVFEIIMNATQFINITDKLVHQFSIETYLQETYKQEKQVLILTQINYSVPEMVQLMKVDGGYQRNKKKIKRLQFASNYVNNIEYFECFQNLASINLDFNHFQDMKHICKFKSLEKLQMRQNKNLRTFNEQVCELQKLQEIKINSCKIQQLPEKISNLSFLSTIKMDKNYLKTLPDSICKISNLKEISFKDNALQSLPQKIGNLTNLKKLILKGNQLKNVPKSIGQLSNLQILDLSQNGIIQLPEGLMKLYKLETLRLQRNDLQKLTPSILQNQTLKYISLHENKLKSLPNTFNGCKNVKNITLHKNEIELLPQTLKQCILLQQITLYQNKIKEIPIWFNIFKRLPHVYNFEKNQLKEFPKYFFDLETVTQINLQYNKIQIIPNRIPRLQELKSLNLANNLIKVIPSNLKELTHLQKGRLQIAYNPLKQVQCFEFCMELGDYQTTIGLEKYAEQHKK